MKIDSVDNLKKSWLKVSKFEHGYNLVPIDSPIEYMIGYDDNLNKSLSVTSKHQSIQLQSSRIIETPRFFKRKSDGCWQFMLNLKDPKFESSFIEMCFDLIKFSSTGINEKDALERFYLRYEYWRNLFDNYNAEGLSEEQQRGLIGELLFLRNLILNGSKSPDEILDGWEGPLKAHQDFIYADRWYEIKTVMSSAKKIQISSLEQLSREDFGELVVFKLESVESDVENFLTLNSLVEEIRTLLDRNSESKKIFENQLAHADYLPIKRYDELMYRVSKIFRFAVDKNFPKLTHKNVPAAIIDATYSISLDQLQNNLISCD
ncbi:MAG: PD-(D/E)XK motif protein [Selenomonadaceae bacterium]|nr:PD-(D/E)XK motif protein [Selenomonadaceae bacterium]